MNSENIIAAITAQQEILDNAASVKGEEFAAKTKIYYAAMNIEAIAQHVAVCDSPA